jgi:hypothetical protein
VLEEERAAGAHSPSKKDARPRQRRRATPLQPHDVPPVDRPPRPPRTAVATAPAGLPQQTVAENQQSPSRDMYPGGPSDTSFGNVDDEDEEDAPAPAHAFPLPVRVPSFLLDPSILTSGRHSLTGIATSSRIDDTGEVLLYRVHLESGHSLEINVGFLEILLPDPEGHEALTEPANDLVESQHPMHGRYSSCEEETDDEVHENEWPTEMMHNPDFSNFCFNSHDTGRWRVGDDSDSEVERAAQSLQGDRNLWGDQLQHPDNVRGRGRGGRSNCKHGGRQRRGQANVDPVCMDAERGEASPQGRSGGPPGAACSGVGVEGAGGPTDSHAQGGRGTDCGEGGSGRPGPGWGVGEGTGKEGQGGEGWVGWGNGGVGNGGVG